MLKELMELNEERIRMEAQMEQTYAVPDEKKTLKRLQKFVEQFHDVIETVNFRGIFKSYQEVVDKKTKTIGLMANEFAALGVIDFNKPTTAEQRVAAEAGRSRQSPV